MKNKLKEFITWMDLASQANAQRGQVQYWQKRYTRLYNQIMNDIATNTVMNVSEVPCFMCSFYSEEIPCKFECSYQLLNHTYLTAKKQYYAAAKKYEQLSGLRRDARQKFFAREK